MAVTAADNSSRKQKFEVLVGRASHSNQPSCSSSAGNLAGGVAGSKAMLESMCSPASAATNIIHQQQQQQSLLQQQQQQQQSLLQQQQQSLLQQQQQRWLHLPQLTVHDQQEVRRWLCNVATVMRVSFPPKRIKILTLETRAPHPECIYKVFGGVRGFAAAAAAAERCVVCCGGFFSLDPVIHKELLDEARERGWDGEYNKSKRAR